MNRITFAYNKPVTLTLHSIEGKERESQFGGNDHLFSCAEGFFYVKDVVGRIITDQCRKLGVQAGDIVEICKAEIDQGRGRKAVQWVVSVPVAGTDEQPEPAQVLRPQPVAVPAPERQTPQSAQERPRWAEVLIHQTTVIVDAYAAVLKHAGEAHGNAVKPEDVRSILLSSFINLSQRGGLSNAA